MKSKFKQQSYVDLKLVKFLGIVLMAEAWKDKRSSKVGCI